jgi:hypothetical protein
MNAGPPRYRLDLVPLPDPIPVRIRLRQFLKLALRLARFRCLSVEEVRPPEPALARARAPEGPP